MLFRPFSRKGLTAFNSWLKLAAARPFQTALIATLAALVLAACEDGTTVDNGSSGDNGTSEPRGGALSTSSGIEGEAGSVLLAVDGALADNEEVEVWLEVVPMPNDGADLSEGVVALGSAFALSSERPVRTSPVAPFLMGLPVPDGADTDQLGIAVLDFDTLYAPPDGDDVSGLKRQWAYLDAVVDTQTNLVISPLLGLTPEPMVAIVVESEAFNSSRSLARNSVTGAEFVGTCGPGFFFADESCTSADRSAAAAMLEQAYNNLTLFGFTDEPHLKRGIGSLDISHQGGLTWSISYVPGPYQIQLRPRSKEDASGMYSSSSGRIWLAIDTDGVTEDRRRTVRHEYIHATQYAGFDGFASTEDWLASRWVIEGQAVVAQASFSAPERDNRDPRAVDTPLDRSRWTGNDWDLPPFSEYRAQDFWWYLLKRFDADISLLKPFMNNGLSTADVDTALRTEFPDAFGGSGIFGGLPQAYWDWVKNQVFEKGVAMDDLRFGDTCAFTTLAATPSSLSYTAGGLNGTVNMSLPPLTSHVVQVTFPGGGAWHERMRVTADSGAVRSTLYESQASGGTLGCIDQVDADTQTVTASDDTQTFYAVIANTSLSNQHAFTLAFDGNVSASITSPEEGAMFGLGSDEFGVGGSGYTITFTGTGSSPLEGSITGSALTWEYLRTDITDGNWIAAGSGETVDIFLPWVSCFWEYYDVRVIATDSQGLSASDTISIAIQAPAC